MSAGKVVVDTLVAIGKWVAKNPTVIKDTADIVVKLKPAKEPKEIAGPTIDDKLDQLGNAALEMNQKFDDEIAALNNEVNCIKNELNTTRDQLQAQKKLLLLLGVGLVLSIVTSVVMAIL